MTLHRFAKPCFLGLRSLQDGDFGVGLFPEREEILIGAAALGCVAHERIDACKAETGQCIDPFGLG